MAKFITNVCNVISTWIVILLGRAMSIVLTGGYPRNIEYKYGYMLYEWVDFRPLWCCRNKR